MLTDVVGAVQVDVERRVDVQHLDDVQMSEGRSQTGRDQPQQVLL